MATSSGRLAALAGYIERLKELKISSMSESLAPQKSEMKTSFGYGFACGIQAGLDMALKALEDYLEEPEER